MKKVFLFIALFVIPILVYLFFASGVNSYSKLPTITENVPELETLHKNSDTTALKFKDRITILGFVNDFSPETRSNMANLCHEVYASNRKYLNLQVVYVTPKGNEQKAQVFIDELTRDANMSTWHFVFAEPEEIKKFYKSLYLQQPLEDLQSPYVNLIDKELKLRGRKGKNNKGEEEYKEGYYTPSPADLNNEMEDDVKVLLFEYGAGTKKNYKVEDPIE